MQQASTFVQNTKILNLNGILKKMKTYKANNRLSRSTIDRYNKYVHLNLLKIKIKINRKIRGK